MKIALIQPPSQGLEDQLAYPPLGLMYLASNVKGVGIEHHIDIYHAENLNKLTYDYDIYGINIHSVATYKNARDISYQIREYHPDARIIMGGACATSMPNYILDNTEADICVSGEGEKAFDNIINDNLRGNKFIYHGIEYDNLDDIAFPARHLLEDKYIRYEGKVHHSVEPATTVWLSRGCSFNCSYCDKSLWGRRYRVRSPENILKELEQVIERYGIHWYRIPDDNLTLNKKWFISLCKALKPLNIKWTCLARGDGVNMEILSAAKDAGCQEIFFGMESGSQMLLNKMNKQIKVEQNTHAIELCRETGVKSCAYMMFGFPGENEETVKDTMNWLKTARPDKSRLSTFLPIPGSDVYAHPEKYGIKIKPNFEDYWYFDNPETHELYDFGTEYLYIGNERMSELRNQMIGFYRDMGYFSGWTKVK